MEVLIRCIMISEMKGMKNCVLLAIMEQFLKNDFEIYFELNFNNF